MGPEHVGLHLYFAHGPLISGDGPGSAPRSASDGANLFLVQLGPVLFVRDTTLLFPVHLSKRHLIWYGFERKVRWLISRQKFSIASAILSKEFNVQNALT